MIRGVRIVYIYQKYEEKETYGTGYSDPKRILIGGLLIAASILFNVIELHTEIAKVGIDVGFSGWDLKDLMSKGAPKDAMGFLLYLPIATPVIGAAVAVTAFLSMKGNDVLSDRQLGLIGLVCIILPAVFFAHMYDLLASEGLIDMLFEEVSLRPGPAMVMQIVGGFIILLTVRKGRSA